MDKFERNDITVLVIEDDETTRELLSRLASNMGAKAVYAASNGAEGLRIACEKRPTICICDLEMEPVDGLAFVGGLRASIHKEVNEIPVVIFTAAKESVHVKKAKALEVVGWLVKPFNPKALATFLCDAVKSRGSAAAPAKKPDTTINV